jgi:hypothetical protein
MDRVVFQKKPYCAAATAAVAFQQKEERVTCAATTTPPLPIYSYESCDEDFVRNEMDKAVRNERKLWREDESPGRD